MMMDWTTCAPRAETREEERWKMEKQSFHRRAAFVFGYGIAQIPFPFRLEDV
jgi:hypothetical protein